MFDVNVPKARWAGDTGNAGQKRRPAELRKELSGLVTDPSETISPFLSSRTSKSGLVTVDTIVSEHYDKRDANAVATDGALLRWL